MKRGDDKVLKKHIANDITRLLYPDELLLLHRLSVMRGESGVAPNHLRVKTVVPCGIRRTKFSKSGVTNSVA